MLIIAVPKSASSSLVSTLCLLQGLANQTQEVRQRFLGDAGKPAAGFDAIARMHRREIVEVSNDLVLYLRKPGIIAKHHIVPTPNNKSLLRDTKKVVLLRDPAEIVRAYKRGDESGAFPIRGPDFSLCITERQWLRRASRIGLLDELERFRSGWRNHDGDKLVVNYDELLDDPKTTVNAIESYFGLPVSSSVSLLRDKYSRLPSSDPPANVASVLWRRRRRIAWQLSRGIGLSSIARRIFKRTVRRQDESI